MKSLLLKYHLLIFLMALFSIGAFLYIKANEEPDLRDISFTDSKIYRVVCSDREKAGKRYLWIKSKEIDTLSSMGRIKDCENYQGVEYKKLSIKYRLTNNVIYSLRIDSKEVISTSNVKDHARQTIITAYLIICIMLSGLYYGFRKQFVEPKKPINGRT